MDLTVAVDKTIRKVKSNESNISSVTAQNLALNDANFEQYGLIPTDGVNEIRPQDMFMEVDVPDTLVDKKGYPVRFTDGIYDRLGSDIKGAVGVVGTGWSTIGTNKYSHSGVDGELIHTVSESLAINVSTTIKIAVTNYVSGSLSVQTNGSVFYNFNTSKNGIYEVVVTNSNSSGTELRFYTTALIADIEILSVKELPQFALPKAPFATGSTDELLDDKLNGVTTQTAHSKGDIVVTGNELVTNGSFDTDTDWTKADGTVTITGGSLIFTSSSTYGEQNIPYLVTGKEYVLTVEIDAYTSGSLYASINGSFQLSNMSAIDTYTTTFVYTGGSSLLRLEAGVAGTTLQIPNVAITLKDQSYIATEDTANMYDYDDLDTNTYTMTTEQVIYCTGNNASGIAGHFYGNNYGANLGVTPNAELLTNTEYFIDLGTATNMSLQNPYFKAIPQVTKQVALLVEKTSTGAILNTVKPLVNMYGEESVLTYEADIMGELGFSQVSDRVWTDGSSEFILLTPRGYLNAGAYHQFFNEFGSGKQININDTGWVYWYDSTARQVKSIFTTFEDKANGVGVASLGNVGHIAGGLIYSGRPEEDSKFYDKAYIAGQGGLVCFALPNANKSSYKHKQEVKRNLKDGYIENGVELFTTAIRLGVNYAYRYSSINWELYMNDATKSNLSIGDLLTFQVQGEGIVEGVITGIALDDVDGANAVTLNGTCIERVGSFVAGYKTSIVMVTKKSPYLVTQGTTTHTDLIGNPTNYPQDLKNLLASGKGVGFMNALLVGQDGTSLIPDGTNKELIFAKKANIILSAIYSTDAGALYSDDTVGYLDNTDYVNNSRTAVFTTNLITFISFEAQNQSAIPIDTPQPIEVVDRDLIASNSHSVYAYNGLTYGATGKVATGSAVSSKGVEDAMILYDRRTDDGYYGTYNIGEVILVVDGHLGRAGHEGVANGLYVIDSRYDGTTSYYIDNNYYDGLGFTTFIGYYPLPTHNTITLDANSIVASKALVTQTANATQVFTEEMVWDYSLDTGDDFTNIASNVVQNTLVVGDYYNITDGPYSGFYQMIEQFTVALLNDTNNLALDRNGNIIPQGDGTKILLKRWDGTGFGDNNQFNQLTNGTRTDSNGATIQTKVLLKQSSIRI